MVLRRRLSLRTASLLLLALPVLGCGTEDVRVTLSSPRDGQSVRSASLLVSGGVDPPGAVVRVNERPVALRAGTFAVTVPLHLGRNRINVAATASGRTSHIQDLVVRRDRTASERAALARRKRSAARKAATAPPVRRPARYPQIVRESFLTNCVRFWSPSGCRCILRYLESNVSMRQLRDAELRLSLAGEQPQFMNRALKSCGVPRPS